MSAESPLNVAELADESSAGLVNRASSQMLTLVRDEIAECASNAACGVTHKIEDSVPRS